VNKTDRQIPVHFTCEVEKGDGPEDVVLEIRSEEAIYRVEREVEEDGGG
jgi:hypothetical protein